MTFPWLFHDQLKFSMTQKCWKPSLLGAYFCSVTRRIFPVFKQHEIFGPKKWNSVTFPWPRLFSLKSMTFPGLENAFSNSMTFHDFSWLFMTVRTPIQPNAKPSNLSWGHSLRPSLNVKLLCTEPNSLRHSSSLPLQTMIKYMESSTFEMKSLHSRSSNVDHTNLMLGSTKTTYVELGWSFHELKPLLKSMPGKTWHSWLFSSIMAFCPHINDEANAMETGKNATKSMVCTENSWCVINKKSFIFKRKV